MSRRDSIRMSESEVDSFLAEQRVLTCATLGRDGFPHLMPLWYLVRDGELWAWTYTKSQKVRNLERDARATIQVEDGHAYDELRGVMRKCDVQIHRDIETVAGIGEALAVRYGGQAAAVGPEARAIFEKQAAKRVGMQFVSREQATWDHRKLGGVY